MGSLLRVPLGSLALAHMKRGSFYSAVSSWRFWGLLRNRTHSGTPVLSFPSPTS